MTFNEKQIKYICKELLGIGDWTPELQPGTFEVLNLCQSKLEIMFLLGAIDRKSVV